jgi:hypothetical protein
MTTALDLISTPVAVLNATALETRAGLSGDDPLCERMQGDRLRVFVSWFDPEGTFAERRELEPIGPGERRMLNLSAPARERFGDRNVLAIIHRVPSSICPPGRDPEKTEIGGAPGEDFDLLRVMVEYGFPGRGRGAVIYEKPPGINGARRKTQSALILSSKIAVSQQQDTRMLLLNVSENFVYRDAVNVRARLFAADGRAVAAHEISVAPFSSALVSIRDWVVRAGEPVREEIATYSVVAWSMEGALIPLFLQTHEAIGSVSVEHSNPPQVYLLPTSQAERFRIKNQAVAYWNSTWAASA